MMLITPINGQRFRKEACNQTYSPPLKGWVKFNFEEESKGNSGQAGAGSPFRDEHGHIMVVSFRFLDIRSNNEAEIEGLVLGVVEGLGRDYKEVLFKGRSNLIINHINRRISHPSSGIVKQSHIDAQRKRLF